MICDQGILDYIRLAEILNQGHETAKADLYYTPNMDRVEAFRVDHMFMAAERVYSNIQDPVIKERLKCEARHRF
jgi:hypothetical protein